MPTRVKTLQYGSASSSLRGKYSDSRNLVERSESPLTMLLVILESRLVDRIWPVVPRLAQGWTP